jgi:hypothetical protein
MTPKRNEILAAFITEAKAFCDAIDGHETLSLGRFVWQLAFRVVRLYGTALQLPDVISETSDNPSDALSDAFSHEQESALRHALEMKLGSFNTYREIFDPYDDPREEPIYGSLGNDLAEIYSDLRDVIAAYEPTKEDTLVDVLWNAQFQFSYHWGEHATKALRVIDSMMHRQNIEELLEDGDA